MLPLILAAARAALPAVGRAVAGRAAAGTAGRAATGGGASRLLSSAQFGAGMAAGSHSSDGGSTDQTPPTESNPVYNR
ncbi:hypothetical protein [Streptomyces sp. H27-C3]|uniref:hypothetical protein n=1 Tax=Streptomyces sp. H27-C3 TaxID=3046305 RepID=UPI0024B9262F|nr:hypothetical protein [Streptomyces sp. H27-C3]MDJ0463180.1 hypothetical protein [Streptomyces sp. H27-C3]